MIYNIKQRDIFRNLPYWEWTRQNRLRNPLIRQFRARLKKYFFDLGDQLYEDYKYTSTLLMDITVNNYWKMLQNIFRVQYYIIAHAFKNYALDRVQNVKDFDSEFDRKLALYIEENVATWVGEINETTRKRITAVINDSYASGLSVDETGTALRNAIIGMGVMRANLISRTETHRTASWANETVAENMQIRGTVKAWIAVQDARTRVTHSIASGQQIPLEQKFVVGGDRLKFPGDPTGSPEETINCRCSVIYTTPDYL